MQAQPRKRMRMDDGCNNNIDNVKTEERETWSCTGDTSLMEPEILRDMGVGMLTDGENSRDSLKTLQTQECTIPPRKFETQRISQSLDSAYGTQEIYKNNSFDVLKPLDRLDEYEIDDNVNFSINESGYSSKIENDILGDCKENFNIQDNSNDNLNKSSTDLYYLYKRKKKFFCGEDKFNTLSDEIILMIMKWLPKKSLVRSMLVCKRWHQIALDEALWTRLDCSYKVLGEGALGHIIPRGIQILRLAQTEIEHPAFYENSDFFIENYTSKLQYLDLSMAVINPDDLACLLSRCKYLKKLSLEKCIVNENCCESIGNNQDLEVLNLTMCEGINLNCIKNIVKLKRLSSLNVSWCIMDLESMGYLLKFLPPSITRLNIAGCRKNLIDENLQDLVKNCCDIVELDLSDCTNLTHNILPSLLSLNKLEHLSLSRCYSVPITVHVSVVKMPNLKFLDIFGTVSEDAIKTLRVQYKNVEFNKFMFSAVARPTVRDRRTSIWGLRVRD